MKFLTGEGNSWNWHLASRMTGRCTRWERWLPGSGGMFKVLNWNLHSFWLLEIIQVLDSISWVRCASGNVFIVQSHIYALQFLMDVIQNLLCIPLLLSKDFPIFGFLIVLA